MNIQSLNSKFNELKNLLLSLSNQKTNVVAIALQEIWQIPHADVLNIPNFTFVYKQRTLNRGGGVAFFIHNDYSFKILNEHTIMHVKFFECIAIEVVVNKKKFVLASVYRSPSSSVNQVDEFIMYFDALLGNLLNGATPYFIFLDSNFNLLKINSCPHSQKYLDVVHNNGFIQYINKATRVQQQSYSLIDHICCKNESSFSHAGTMISDISDHFVNFLTLEPAKKASNKSSCLYRRNITSHTMELFRNSLEKINWSFLKDVPDVDDAFDGFWDIFSTFYNLSFPLKKVKFNKNIHKVNQFMTKGLLISRAKKLILHKTFLTEKTDISFAQYKNYRNIYNNLVKKSREKFYTDSLNGQKNPKKIWDIYKELTTGKKSENSIKEILVNNSISTNSKEMSEEFNAFFSTVGSKISKSIKKIDQSADHYLPKDSVTPILKIDDVGPVLICDIIKSLQNKKSCDIDGISTSLLKFLNTTISTPLALIFNLSIKQGNFPTKLKSSRVVPIFKSGNPLLCDNYRPISLVSSIAKIFEKIVATQLTNHLELNKLINKHQFGFQKGLSTEHNLLHLTNFISKTLNSGKFCIGIFLDLKKAFDVVNHGILSKKLFHLGVRDNILRWFQSYLSNRTQKVEINGVLSSPRNINISVLQGSVLGPLLFLCFINDIFSATNLLTLLFADDTCALAAGDDINELHKLCNTELQKIANWFSANLISVNVSKCKYIIFHNKGKKIPNITEEMVFNLNEIGKQQLPENISPLIRVHNNDPLAENQTYKYLGILLDENLTFNKHIDYLCKKLNRALFCMRRIKNTLNTKSLRTLYFTLFHSHLLYCIKIFSCTKQSNITRIILLQKKAIRLISKANYRDHTAPLFHLHNILPFDKILTMHRMTFMHSIHYEYAHTSFNNIWTKNSNTDRAYNLRNDEQYTIPAPKFENFKLFPLYTFPKIWNELSLSNTFCMQHNPITFRIALRETLLRQLLPE